MTIVNKFTERFLAYRQILERMLAHIVQPNEVEDIIQETWVRVVKAEMKEEVELPNSYMYRTAKNLAFDHIKSVSAQKLDMAKEPDLQLAADNEGDKPFIEFQSSERFESFCRAVRVLPSSCRRAFVLKKVYGFSQKEIAEYMDISESAVEKHVAKGMLRCSDYLIAKGVIKEKYQGAATNKSYSKNSKRRNS